MSDSQGISHLNAAGRAESPHMPPVCWPWQLLPLILIFQMWVDAQGSAESSEEALTGWSSYLCGAGVLPEEWGEDGSLAELSFLDLSANDFSGTVPSWMSANRCNLTPAAQAVHEECMRLIAAHSMHPDCSSEAAASPAFHCNHTTPWHSEHVCKAFTP